MKGLIKVSMLVVMISLSFGVWSKAAHSQSASANTSCTVLTSNMKLGSRDALTAGDVLKLQNFLYSEGYLKVSPTGYFGVLTKASVINYQRDNGIIAEGYVGPITRAFIATHSCGDNISPTANSNVVPNSSSYIVLPVTTEQFAVASDGTPLYWDVYQPSGTGLWPAMLDIQSAGFTGFIGGPELIQSAKDLAAAGYITFMPHIRLAPPGSISGQKSDGRYPQQTDDVKLAVIAARHDSRANGKVGALGGSGGGHHTAYVAATGVVGYDRIDAGASLSGAYDFSDPISRQSTGFNDNVTNYVNSTDTSTLLAASPISKVTKDISPLFLYESTHEPMPYNQYVLMKAKLDSLGVTNYQTLVLDGSTHSFANWSQVASDGRTVGQHAIAFLDSYLKTSAGTTPPPCVSASIIGCAPKLTSLSPSSGPVGTQVTINGSGFVGSCIAGTSCIPNTVMMDGYVVGTFSSSNGSSLTFPVPSALTPYCTTYTCSLASIQVLPGPHSVSVKNSYGTSNALNFTVGTTNSFPPSIVSVDPNPVAPGQALSIFGGYFTPFNNTILVDGVNLGNYFQLITGSASHLLVAVPSTLLSGTHSLVVQNSNGTSKPFNFTVVKTTQFPPPTATLTVNGGSSATITAGNSVTLAWSSTNGAVFSALATGGYTWNDGKPCANVTPGITTANGSKTLSGFQAYCYYTITYNVAGVSGNASASVKITVNPVQSFPPPTATFTANGLKSVTLNVGDNITFAWGSTNGAVFSSSYTSSNNNSCGSGSWIANNNAGSASATILSSDANCTYTFFYHVVGVAGNADSQAIVVVNPTPTYNLVVTKTGAGTVTSVPAGISCGSTCSKSFSPGTVVTLSVVPITGNFFSGWSGACTGTGTCTVTMSAAKSVTATFKPYTFNTLTMNVVGNGTIVSSPSGINCGYVGNDCSETYTTGSTPTKVTLSISYVQGGFYFGSWSGACTGTGTCTVTMDTAKTVTATFKSYTGFNYDPGSSNVANVLNAINNVLQSQSIQQTANLNSVLDFLLGNLKKVSGK